MYNLGILSIFRHKNIQFVLSAELSAEAVSRRWVTCNFASFLTVLQSCQDDRWMIMKGCVDRWMIMKGCVQFTIKKILPSDRA